TGGTGGSAGIICPLCAPGTTCFDYPHDTCDPALGDTNCRGTCVSCAVSGGCANAPACGAGCCAQGGGCDGVTVPPTCRCGNGAACGPGDICARPGPTGIGVCGNVCCGVSQGCPR